LCGGTNGRDIGSDVERGRETHQILIGDSYKPDNKVVACGSINRVVIGDDEAVPEPQSFSLHVMNCPVEKLSAFAAPAQASVNDIHEKAAILFKRMSVPLYCRVCRNNRAMKPGWAGSSPRFCPLGHRFLTKAR
jgi:hypothetical protein